LKEVIEAIKALPPEFKYKAVEKSGNGFQTPHIFLTS